MYEQNVNEKSYWGNAEHGKLKKEKACLFLAKFTYTTFLFAPVYIS